MGVETVIAIGRSALELTLVLAGPVLVLSLAAGLAVSIFQALTQINEITLTFIPKIAATAAALILFGPWMIAQLLSFTTTLCVAVERGMTVLPYRWKDERAAAHAEQHGATLAVGRLEGRALPQSSAVSLSPA